ncbi:DNA polymerase III subunit epsilon [Pelagibacteraceae bacterium]|nr:DNA polymerase III subunit epsilon [Pelagibacteraceae bacterium]
MREVVIDTETTGLNYRTDDRIIEVGCVELNNYVPTGKTLQFYCKPDKEISEGAKSIVGISDEFLQNKKSFQEHHKTFLEFIKNDTLIIHNADFDLGFLNKELSLIGLPPLQNSIIDTVPLAREVLNTRVANLDYLCRRFDIDLSDRSFHGALLDSQLLASVYLELRGGKQFSMQLESDEPKNKKDQLLNKNSIKTKEIELNNDELSAHKNMLKKLKNPIWNKFNY